MTVHDELLARCESQCELCKSDNNLAAYEVPPNSDGSLERCVMLCELCRGQLEQPESMDANHWRCLNDTMWSQVPQYRSWFGASWSASEPKAGPRTCSTCSISRKKPSPGPRRA